jgi:predicted nucleic acid-binding protein
MTAERFTLDANLLFYAMDLDAGEKHRIARHLVESAVALPDCLLTLQALAEFFWAVTRKRAMPGDEAAAQVADWQVIFPVVHAKPANLRQALRVANGGVLSFWDALLWSTAKDAGVTVLLSEDFQDGQNLEGVLFRNPFTSDDPFAPAG